MVKEQVTKDTVIGEIINKHPEAIEVMLNHGMHCIGCHVATWETVEQAASSHGIDVEELLKKINKAIA